MKELKGFYNEEVLEEMLYKGEISRLEFIYHHSQKRIDDYKAYCQKKGLQEDEESAEAFADFLLRREEKEHTEELD